MTAGLQVFNANGQLMIDISSNLSRLVGSAQTGSVDGSLAIPAFASGRGWVYALDTSENFLGPIRRPYFTIGTSGVSWYFGGQGQGTPTSVTFLYGIF